MGWHFSWSCRCVWSLAVYGCSTGLLVAYQKIPSFIVTLAGMLVFRGLTYVVLEGRPIGPFPKEFTLLSTGFIPDFLPLTGSCGLRHCQPCCDHPGRPPRRSRNLLGMKNRRLNDEHGTENEPFVFFVMQMGIISVVRSSWAISWPPIAAAERSVVMGVLIALYSFVTTRTTSVAASTRLAERKGCEAFGHQHREADLPRLRQHGVLAALAGMIIAARLNSATPKAALASNSTSSRPASSAVPSASGGVGKITGAVIGAFIMGVMNNGMSIMGIGIDYQQLIKGLVLLAAVFFDVYNKNKAV